VSLQVRSVDRIFLAGRSGSESREVVTPV
jgi:hypothetical protein